MITTYIALPPPMPLTDILQTARRNKIRGGLLGLVIGDCVGLPYEHVRKTQLPTREHIEALLNGGLAKNTVCWSSDSAQSLALLDSLQTCQGLNLDDFAHRLLAWRETGAYTSHGTVIGCGITTDQALDRLSRGISPELSGNDDEQSNGNGSLMRCLPLALWHQGSDSELIRLAIRQSLPTHAHPLSGVVCATYCLVARQLLKEQPIDWDLLIAMLEPQLRPTEHAQLPKIFDVSQRYHPQGTAYVVDCFWSAIHTLHANNFSEAIEIAIQLGNDTNTTACVAGGLAGIRFGLAGLPMFWREFMATHSILKNYFEI